MRKILFATERINANSTETFYFIGVLVVFAAAASAVVSCLKAADTAPTSHYISSSTSVSTSTSTFTLKLYLHPYLFLYL